MVGKIEDKRRRGWQKVRLLGSITDSVDMNLGKLWDSGGQRSIVGYSPWGRKESDRTERLHFTSKDLDAGKD